MWLNVVFFTCECVWCMSSGSFPSVLCTRIKKKGKEFWGAYTEEVSERQNKVIIQCIYICVWLSAMVKSKFYAGKEIAHPAIANYFNLFWIYTHRQPPPIGVPHIYIHTHFTNIIIYIVKWNIFLGNFRYLYLYLNVCECLCVCVCALWICST